MATNKRPTSSSRDPTVLVTCVFALLLSGILFLSWKDIYSEVPKFEQLREARANGFRANIARAVNSPHQYSIEFYDGSGKRYQVRGIQKPERDQIAAALSAEDPVLIRYGPWSSPFPSAKIFTVYQLEIGKRVVIPYGRLASAKQREQSAGPLIMLCTLLVAGFAIFIGVRRQKKFQRQLDHLKSRKSIETKS